MIDLQLGYKTINIKTFSMINLHKIDARIHPALEGTLKSFRCKVFVGPGCEIENFSALTLNLLNNVFTLFCYYL